MATSTDPLRRESIQVVARDTGDRYQAPPSNAALDLAHSLASIAPEANQALQGYAADQRAAYAQKARKAALETSGALLADAVRDGKIKPTQNPWFMEAYAKEGAAIRAQRALGDLTVQAQSWDTRDDPQAFEKQWREGVASIAEQYQGKDETAGFLPVEAQFTQQALQSNLSVNAKRIEAERTDNLTALSAGALTATYKANGGTLTAEQGAAALLPAKQQWIATGGTEAGWQQMAIKAATTASYSTGDARIGDAILKDPSLGSEGKPLYDLPGVAEAWSTDKYRIGQAQEFEATGRMRTQAAQLKGRGQEALDGLWEKHGTSLITGEFDTPGLISELTAKGFKPAEIAATFSLLKDVVSDNAGLGRARLEVNGQNPGSALALMQLGVKAHTSGLSSGDVQTIGGMVTRGELSWSEGQSFLNAASATADRQDARADRAEARAERAADRADRQLDKRFSRLNRNADGLTSVVVSTFARAFPKTPLPSEVRTRWGNNVSDAMASHLERHPGDFEGANAAGRAVVAKYVRTIAQKRAYNAAHPQGASTPRLKAVSTTGNPRR